MSERKEDPRVLDELVNSMMHLLAVFPKKLIRMEEIQKAYDLTYYQILSLFLIAERDLTLTEMSDTLGVSKPNLNPLVKSLESKGMIVRWRSPKDRRKMMIRLSEEGKQCHSQLKQYILEEMTLLKTEVSHQEIEVINTSLRSFNRILDRM
ncbi:MAG: MarR family transcriptional regulator [Clostridia bacterium]|nr:MarR family transcriptional regulator [Clostridia bacterium]